MDPGLRSALLAEEGPLSAERWAAGIALEQLLAIAESLWALSAESAWAFLEVSPAVLSILTSEERSEWEFPGRMIFGGGAGLPDPSRASVPAAPAVLSAGSFRSYKGWAEQAVRIAERAPRAAAQYLRSSPAFLGHADLVQARQWGEWAVEIVAASAGTPDAAVALLQSSPGMLELLSPKELKGWKELGARIAWDSPDLASRYFAEVPAGIRSLERSERLAVLCWASILGETSPGAAFDFLQRCCAILLDVAPGARRGLLEAVRRLSGEAPEAVLRELEEVAERVISVPPSIQRTFVELGLSVAERSAEAARTFFGSGAAAARKLPEALLRRWVERGMALLVEDEERGLGFFALRTAEPRRELSKWQQAAVLDDHRELLRLLGRALTGHDLQIQSTEEIEAPGSGARTGQYPTSDGRTIYLPPYWAGGTAEENFRQYKLAAAHHAGCAAFGTFSPKLPEILDLLQRLPAGHWAVDMFLTLEAGRVDQRLGREFPGLKGELESAFEAALASRPPPHELPPHEALAEMVLRASLGRPLAGNAPPELRSRAGALLGSVADFYREPRTVRDSFLTALAICGSFPDLDSAAPYRPRPPIPFRGRLDPGLLADSIDWGELAGEAPEGESETLPTSLDELDLLVEGDSLESRAALKKLLTPVGRRVRDGEEFARAAKERLRREAAKPPRASVLLPLAPGRSREPFYYDEWDYLQGAYRRRWCCLRECPLEPRDPGLYDRICDDYADVIQRVRRQFRRVRPQELQVIRRSEWGEEIDLAEVIQRVVDRRAGESPSDRVFSRREKRIRRVATLLLVDMSASTDQPIPGSNAGAPPAAAQLHCESWKLPRTEDSKKIIDIEVESLVVMVEALESLKDDYAVFGFSGCGRGRVEFYPIKDFADPFSAELKSRIGGIRPRQSTRMGPAIRHAVGKLKLLETDQRLLILVSDGFPQDQDYGEDRRSAEYGLQDTMMALLEARQQGIRPFCITVDQSGHDYLRKICDPRSYLVIRDMRALPEVLPRVVESLMA